MQVRDRKKHFFCFGNKKYCSLGRAEGKTYCQEFPVGRGYSIAFLEPNSMNKTDHKTFTPADFAEIHEHGNSTNELLAHTCNLHRIVPLQSLASVSDVCPAVGTDPICLQNTNTTTGTVLITNILLNATNRTVSDVASDLLNKTIIVTDPKEHLTHPIHSAEQEIEAIRSKSGSAQVDVDTHNNAKSITFSLFLMIMAIFFCSN